MAWQCQEPQNLVPERFCTGAELPESAMRFLKFPKTGHSITLHNFKDAQVTIMEDKLWVINCAGVPISGHGNARQCCRKCHHLSTRVWEPAHDGAPPLFEFLASSGLQDALKRNATATRAKTPSSGNLLNLQADGTPKEPAPPAKKPRKPVLNTQSHLRPIAQPPQRRVLHS